MKPLYIMLLRKHAYCRLWCYHARKAARLLHLLKIRQSLLLARVNGMGNRQTRLSELSCHHPTSMQGNTRNILQCGVHRATYGNKVADLYANSHYKGKAVVRYVFWCDRSYVIPTSPKCSEGLQIRINC